ncbi:MAG: HAMP domain-containing histidine kinase [Acidobacteriia bacterium]|nr:HAMP domain-containing histidine kinase [Terriglobia bacterium]
MFKKLYPDSWLRASDLASFQRQESIFIVLNLALLAVLLLLHVCFASYWGTPTRALVVVLGVGFLLKALELVWVQRMSRTPSPTALVLLTWASILVNLVLAVVLTFVADHQDSPYFVLFIMPIVEAAFRFHLLTVVGVVAIADFYNFLWVWHYFQHHPPADMGEYFEAGIASLTFLIVGVLVWHLVSDLRRKEMRLASNLLELEGTREKLLQEEKLAAVGRLSSAIAHEIRNPVSMIASSLATAKQLSGPEREEMFEIASEEAARLVTLTTDFLAYARPRPPKLLPSPVTDTVAYVADACRAHASQKGVQLRVEAPETVVAAADTGQLQQALINLVMNAVEASPANGTVWLRVQNGHERVCIDIENRGAPIPEPTRSRIFEPFFTTRPLGSGLGLAIARNIARAHGGDLTLAANGPEGICFSLTLPVTNGHL